MAARRKSVSKVVKDLLLVRSGNQCAFPGCTNAIFDENNQLVAQLAHIEAANPGGERYNPNQTEDERNGYDNLMYLCYEHHVETNNVEKYTVSILKEMKRKHEIRFSNCQMEIGESLAANIEQKEKEFQRLDHRLNVSIGYQKGSMNFAIEAVKEPVEFSLLVRSTKENNILEKIRKHFEDGAEITLYEEEFHLSGNKVISEISKNMRSRSLTIGTHRRIEMVMSLETIDKNGQINISVHGVKGFLTVGTKRFFFEGELDNSPLRVKLGFPLAMGIGDNFDLELYCDFSIWENHNILSLPFLERTYLFLKSLTQGNKLSVNCEHQGYHLFSGASNSELSSYFSDRFFTVEKIYKLQKICSKLSCNVKLPNLNQFSELDLNSIDRFFSIISDGTYRKKVNGGQVKIKITPGDEEIIPEIGTKLYFRQITDDDIHFIASIPLPIGHLKLDLTEVILVETQPLYGHRDGDKNGEMSERAYCLIFDLVPDSEIKISVIEKS